MALWDSNDLVHDVADHLAHRRSHLGDHLVDQTYLAHRCLLRSPIAGLAWPKVYGHDLAPPSTLVANTGANRAALQRASPSSGPATSIGLGSRTDLPGWPWTSGPHYVAAREATTTDDPALWATARVFSGHHDVAAPGTDLRAELLAPSHAGPS